MTHTDHLHFLLDDLELTSKDVKRIVNGRRDKKNRKMTVDKMMYLINLRLDTYFRERGLRVRAMISTDEMITRAAGETE